MPEWKWLHILFSWLPGRERRDDFAVVSKESRDNFQVADASKQGLIGALQSDLDGLRRLVKEQDEMNRQLRLEVQQLHQQHMNCEMTQRRLEIRVVELESEVKRLQQRPTGEF